MSAILFPALAMGGVGLILGTLLAVAAKVFYVKTDERIPRIVEALPGANCGGCGFAGCAAYAKAIVEDGAALTACSAGGQAAADAIAAIMGTEAETIAPRRAVICCAGTEGRAFDKYEYSGTQECGIAVKLPGGGHKSCRYGCLGYGSCAEVCPTGAISIVDGVATVDEEKCGGCGACAKVCPKGIILMVPVQNKVVVTCMSCDKGAAMKSLCAVGCIGCRICEKNCPSGAITVGENHATIDYDKCTNCGVCAEKCPRGIIRIQA